MSRTSRGDCFTASCHVGSPVESGGQLSTVCDSVRRAHRACPTKLTVKLHDFASIATGRGAKHPIYIFHSHLRIEGVGNECRTFMDSTCTVNSDSQWEDGNSDIHFSWRQPHFTVEIAKAIFDKENETYITRSCSLIWKHYPDLMYQSSTMT